MRVFFEVDVKDTDGEANVVGGVEQFDGVFGELGGRGVFAESIERVEERADLIVDVIGHVVVFKELVEIDVMEPQTETLGSSKDAWRGVEKLRSRDFVVGVCHDGVGG